MQLVRDYMCDYYTPEEELYKPFISMLMRSEANLAIVPIQDYLGLGKEARMNQPSTVGKNWKWRVTEEQLSEELKEELRKLTVRFGRFPWK